MTFRQAKMPGRNNRTLRKLMSLLAAFCIDHEYLLRARIYDIWNAVCFVSKLVTTVTSLALRASSLSSASCLGSRETKARCLPSGDQVMADTPSSP